MIRGPKLICIHPLDFTVTITLSGVYPVNLRHERVKNVLKRYLFVCTESAVCNTKNKPFFLVDDMRFLQREKRLGFFYL